MANKERVSKSKSDASIISVKVIFLEPGSVSSLPNPNLVLTKPLGYLDFLALIKHSKVVLTDSGGLQEETTSLGIPCITLRDNTERPITIEQGTNVLVGNKTEKITIEWENICRNGGKSGRIPELWDGKTSERITDVIVEFLKEN